MFFCFSFFVSSLRRILPWAILWMHLLIVLGYCWCYVLGFSSHSGWEWIRENIYFSKTFHTRHKHTSVRACVQEGIGHRLLPHRHRGSSSKNKQKTRTKTEQNKCTGLNCSGFFIICTLFIQFKIYLDKHSVIQYNTKLSQTWNNFAFGCLFPAGVNLSLSLSVLCMYQSNWSFD